MRNPVQRAAEYAARPLLMRETGLEGVHRLLSGQLSPRRPGLLGRAARLLAGEGEMEGPGAATGPEAFTPRWMGEVESTGSGWVLKDGVAYLDIWGALWPEGFGWGDCWWHGYDTLHDSLDQIAADGRVGAIMARFDSPGGVLASGLAELARVIRERSARGGGKPIWAVCESAYSAAYWLASQCDRVIAPREGGVGSIGCVITHMSLAGMLEQDGVVVTPIEWPIGKTDGAWHQPLSDSAKAAMLAEVKQGMAWFVTDVVSGRPQLNPDALAAMKAACFYGDADDPALSGLRVGLVDAVMTEREAFAALRDLAAGSPAPSTPPAVSTATQQTTESPMNVTKTRAALKASGLTEPQIAAALAAAAAAEDDEGTQPAGEESAPGEDDPDAPEGEEGDDQVDNPDDEEAAAAQGPSGAQVLAILDLPEAKGREALARTLAGEPGMTPARAKRLLAAAPKVAGLQVIDPPVAPNGGAAAAGDDFAQGKALAERMKAYRGGRR